MALRLVDRLDGVERFLEIGAGRGDVLIALGKRGLRGRGIDFSAEAVRICQQRIAAEGLGHRLSAEQGDLFALEDDGGYHLAIAFEVLEHIEDDRGALERIRRLLRPGGYFLLSVPAHMRKWGAIDVWAGHVRRYERDELLGKLRDAGFAAREVLSYGYPLLNLTYTVRNLVYPRAGRGSARERTMASGHRLPKPARLLGPLVPAYAWLVQQTQRPFLRSNLGAHYFVLAQRDDSAPSHARGG